MQLENITDKAETKVNGVAHTHIIRNINSGSDDNNDSRNVNIEGNIILPEWHYYILSGRGKPDHVAIMIISELMMGYKADGCRHFQYGYKYFLSKFNYTRPQVRAAFIRLEKAGLIHRKYLTNEYNGRTFNNEILIIFYPENLRRLADSFKNITNVKSRTMENFRDLQKMSKY